MGGQKDVNDTLRRICPGIGAISADIRDMDPACYKKSLKG